jgi:hypothetical protein
MPPIEWRAASSRWRPGNNLHHLGGGVRMLQPSVHPNWPLKSVQTCPDLLLAVGPRFVFALPLASSGRPNRRPHKSSTHALLMPPAGVRSRPGAPIDSRATSPLIVHLDIRSELAVGISASFMSRSANWLSPHSFANAAALPHVGFWLASEGRGADASIVAISL